MNSLFINNWFTTEIFRAFCWTLVHSLWQGLLAAAVAEAYCYLYQKIICPFALQPAWHGIAFIPACLRLYLLPAGNFKAEISLQVTGMPGTSHPDILAGTGTIEAITIEQAPHYIDQFISYLNNNAAFIVLP